MSLTRREFIQRTALTLPAALLAVRSGGLFASAAPPSVPASGRNVIFLELFGGNDGLNTMVPWGLDPYYSTFRPTIGIPAAEVLQIPGQPVGFNPGLAGLRDHFDAGRLAVIQGVSYPNPSFSHDYAQRIWLSGNPTPQADGWLARYLNGLPAPAFPEFAELTGTQTLLTTGANGFAPVFSSISDLAFPGDYAYTGDTAVRRAAYAALAANSGQQAGPLGTAGNTARGLLDLIGRFETVPPVSYTGQYPDTWLSYLLQQVVRLVSGGTGMHFFHLGTGGFDTHYQQEANNYHTSLLQNLTAAITAFYTDLAMLGVAQDTLIVIFSEFGRTVYENGTQGTDHGTVNPVIVLCGAGVARGMVNDHPPLDPSQLDPVTGQLRAGADFRDVFGTILMRWCGASQAEADTVFMGHTVTDLNFLA